MQYRTSFIVVCFSVLRSVNNFKLCFVIAEHSPLFFVSNFFFNNFGNNNKHRWIHYEKLGKVTEILLR